jgi:hypothetical protein
MVDGVGTFEEANAWLRDAAIRMRPQSDFARHARSHVMLAASRIEHTGTPSTESFPDPNAA